MLDTRKLPRVFEIDSFAKGLNKSPISDVKFL